MRIVNSVVMIDTEVKTHSYISSSIIGRKCTIGAFFGDEQPVYRTYTNFQAAGFESKIHRCLEKTFSLRMSSI